MASTSARRRDAKLAVVAGTLVAIALNIWYNALGGQDTATYFWLSRIHEPFGFVAERAAYTLYPRVGYPWCMRWALAFGYLLLVGAWIAALFVAFEAARAVTSIGTRRSSRA
jgi:hypothetical protein